MRGINMNDFYMCINVKQDGILYVLIHWNYKRVRMINLIPNFLNWLSQIIYFALFNFHANLCQYLSNQNITHILILSECYY